MDDQDKLLAKARHYRKLARHMTDQRLVDVLEELASEYEHAAQHVIARDVARRTG